MPVFSVEQAEDEFADTLYVVGEITKAEWILAKERISERGLYCCLNCRKVVFEGPNGTFTICPHTGMTTAGHNCNAC